MTGETSKAKPPNRRRSPVRFISSRLGQIEISRETKSEREAKEELQIIKTAIECLEDRQ